MKTMRAVLVLFVLGLFLAGPNTEAFAKNKFQKEVDAEKVAVKLVREVARGGYRVVTAAELKGWIDEGREMLIVDTMPYKASYRKAHVPGAKQFLFPVEEMKSWDMGETGGKSEQDYASLLGSDKNKTLVIYCGFVKCGRSHNGALWAKQLGYRNVYRFSGGIFAWKGAGYPVEKVK